MGIPRKCLEKMGRKKRTSEMVYQRRPRSKDKLLRIDSTCSRLRTRTGVDFIIVLESHNKLPGTGPTLSASPFPHL
jgi:hypothetical protein